jgi:hypothetical protein
VVQSRTAALPSRGDKAAEALNRALLGDDAVVRKNVLTAAAAPPLASLLRAEVLEACFQDDDTGIVLLALNAYKYHLKPGLQSQALKTLLSHPAAQVRAEIAKVVSGLGPAGLEYLRQLATDTEPTVRIEATRRLILRRDPAALEGIAALAETRGPEAEQVANLLPLLRIYPDSDVRGMLVEIAAAAAAPLQAAAVSTLAALRGAAPPVDLFLHLSASDSARVRQAALRALARPGIKLNLEQCRQLYRQPHAEVRSAALSRAAALERNAIQSMVFEALLDQDVTVRCTALRIAGSKRVSDWHELMRRSLADTDPEIQRTAAMVLLRNWVPESRKILEEFVAENRNPELTVFLQRELRRREHATTPPAAGPARP